MQLFCLPLGCEQRECRFYLDQFYPLVSDTLLVYDEHLIREDSSGKHLLSGPKQGTVQCCFPIDQRNKGDAISGKVFG